MKGKSNEYTARGNREQETKIHLQRDIEQRDSGRAREEENERGRERGRERERGEGERGRERWE